MIQQNKYYFKELDIRNAFRKDVEEIFADNDVIDKLGTDVYVVSGTKKEKTTFPCIYVDVTNSSVAERHSSNTEIQHYTDFTITFDIYSKELDQYNQDDAVIVISEILIEKIQNKYHSLIITLNQQLPNLDQTVSRKQVRFEGVMDNKENFIYTD